MGSDGLPPTWRFRYSQKNTSLKWEFIPSRPPAELLPPAVRFPPPLFSPTPLLASLRARDSIVTVVIPLTLDWSEDAVNPGRELLPIRLKTSKLSLECKAMDKVGSQ